MLASGTLKSGPMNFRNCEQQFIIFTAGQGKHDRILLG